MYARAGSGARCRTPDHARSRHRGGARLLGRSSSSSAIARRKRRRRIGVIGRDRAPEDVERILGSLAARSAARRGTLAPLVLAHVVSSRDPIRGMIGAGCSRARRRCRRRATRIRARGRAGTRGDRCRDHREPHDEEQSVLPARLQVLGESITELRRVHPRRVAQHVGRFTRPPGVVERDREVRLRGGALRIASQCFTRSVFRPSELVHGEGHVRDRVVCFRRFGRELRRVARRVDRLLEVPVPGRSFCQHDEALGARAARTAPRPARLRGRASCSRVGEQLRACIAILAHQRRARAAGRPTRWWDRARGASWADSTASSTRCSIEQCLCELFRVARGCRDRRRLPFRGSRGRPRPGRACSSVSARLMASALSGVIARAGHRRRRR